MDESRSDIFQQLELAVEQWSAQVANAQQGLAEQLERTRTNIDAVADGLTPASGVAPSEDAAERLEAFGELLARFTEVARDATDRLAQLREEVHGFRSELEALRETENRQSNAVTDALGEFRQCSDAFTADAHALRQEMSSLRTELDIARGLLERASGPVRPGPADFSESEPGRGAAEGLGALREAARLTAQLEDDAGVSDTARGVKPFQAFDASGSRRLIGEILLQAGVVTKEQLDQALTEQEQAPHRRLGGIFIEKGFAGETVIAQVLASQLKTRFVRLNEEPIDADVVKLLSPRVARRHECVPLRTTDDRLILAMANPFDLIAIDDAELASGLRVDPVVATSADIQATLDRHLPYTAS